MRKMFAVFILLMALLAINLTTYAAQTQPLCNIFSTYNSGPNPNLPPGIVIYFDARDYDTDWFEPTQWSQGGYKFMFESGYWTTEADRDAVISTIESVTFTNLSKKATYRFTNPSKYSFTYLNGIKYWLADYGMWLGEKRNAVGLWQIDIVKQTVVGKNRVEKIIYTSQFDATEDNMVNVESTWPVWPIDVQKTSDNFKVCFQNNVDLATHYYRVRVLDGMDLVYDNIFEWLPDGQMCTTIPLVYENQVARIELRTNSVGFAFQPPSCQWNSYISRRCTHFKVYQYY